MKKFKLFIPVILAFLILNHGFVFAQNPEEAANKKKIQKREWEKQLAIEKAQKAEIEAMLKQRISAEKEQELLAIIREQNEQQAQDLLRLREDNSMDYYKYLLQLQHEQKQLEQIKESDPERYELHKKAKELEDKITALVIKYHNSNNKKEKNKIKIELKSSLNALFDYREQPREDEIKRLNEKLNQMRKVLEKRKKKKAEIVENRWKELLGELSDLSW